MIPLYSAAQIRQQDAYLIEKMGFPSAQLMELAGHGIAQWLHNNHPDASFHIYCGAGNNGGDGYVIARWLALWGHPISCIAVSPPRTSEAKLNADRLHFLNVPVIESGSTSQQPSDIAIDAILGTGQRLPLKSPIDQAVKQLSQHRGLIYAVDIPTGMQPDSGHKSPHLTGRLRGTFALGGRKLCHYASSVCGQIIDIDIGLNIAFDAIPHEFKPKAFVVESQDIPQSRKTNSDMVKWHKGHLAIAAKRGAAVLAAQAALTTGIGLVSLLMPKEEWPYLHGLPPEVILSEPQDLNPKRHDALVIGPAWGFKDNDWVIDVWNTFPNPLLADADALRIIDAAQTKARFPRIVTPHSAEAAALLKKDRSFVEAEPYKALHALDQIATIAVLKGPYTKLSAPVPLVFPVADSRLGVAGSGDILSGLIGAYVAAGYDLRDAVLKGTWEHAMAVPPPENPSSRGILLRLNQNNGLKNKIN